MKGVVGSLALALLMSITGLFLLTASASAGTNALSRVVLSESLPGFVVDPAGPTNGPINQSNLNYFGGNAGIAAQMLAHGEVIGFVRRWIRQPPNGEAVIILALQFQDSSTATEAMDGAKATAGKIGGYAIPVPDVPGAQGFSLQGSGSLIFEDIFVKADTFFEVTVASTSSDLTSVTAASLAARQAAAAPEGGSVDGSSTQGAYQLGELVGALLIIALPVGLVVLLVRRGRNKDLAISVRAPLTGATSSMGEFTAPEVSLRHPGWYGSGANPYEQRYWNGQGWIGSRRWDRAGWVEDKTDR
jgi:hypothetical protein